SYRVASVASLRSHAGVPDVQQRSASPANGLYSPFFTGLEIPLSGGGGGGGATDAEAGGGWRHGVVGEPLYAAPPSVLLAPSRSASSLLQAPTGTRARRGSALSEADTTSFVSAEGENVFSLFERRLPL